MSADTTAHMAGHTPGPWKVLHTPTRKETFWAVVTHSDAPAQAVIALIDGKSKAHSERPDWAEANAALIAAAPDLLAEYERLRRELAAQAAIIARDTATIANLKLALRDMVQQFTPLDPGDSDGVSDCQAMQAARAALAKGTP